MNTLQSVKRSESIKAKQAAYGGREGIPAESYMGGTVVADFKLA